MAARNYLGLFENAYAVTVLPAEFIIMLNMENRIEPIKAGRKPLTVNPGTIYAVNANKTALIIIVNNPRVITFTGNVSIIIIGLIDKFIRPIIKVAIKAVKKPAIATPGTM
jgi:hypothetical protein